MTNETETGGVGEEMVEAVRVELSKGLYQMPGEKRPYESAARRIVAALTSPSPGIGGAVSVEPVAGWRDVEKDPPPLEQRLDVWVCDVLDDGTLDEGFRWPDVEIIGPRPYALKVWSNDGEPRSDFYHLDQNGQTITHWRPLPEHPTND